MYTYLFTHIWGVYNPCNEKNVNAEANKLKSIVLQCAELVFGATFLLKAMLDAFDQNSVKTFFVDSYVTS